MFIFRIFYTLMNLSIWGELIHNKPLIMVIGRAINTFITNQMNGQTSKTNHSVP